MGFKPISKSGAFFVVSFFVSSIKTYRSLFPYRTSANDVDHGMTMLAGDPSFSNPVYTGEDCV